MSLENLPARTLSRRRVGLCLLLATFSRRDTAAGTRTTSLRFVARIGFANAVRPLPERKTRVFLPRCALKLRPEIVSVPPTATRIGWTRVICGAGALLRFCAPAVAGTTRRAAAISVREVMMMRRIAVLSTFRIGI